MKKIGAILLVILLLSGCGGGSYTTYKSIQSQNSHSFSMVYEKFNGTKIYTIQADGEETAVDVDIVTESGNLAVTIAKDGEEPVYTGNRLPTMGFTVYLKEEGKHTVTLTAENHSGSYCFDWGE